MKRRSTTSYFFVLVLFLFPVFGAKGQTVNRGNMTALIGAKIYPAPFEQPVMDGVVLIKNGKIKRVGAREKVKIPSKANVLDCTGMVIMAGFWNCHVHFMEPQWQGTESQSAEQLSHQMEAMLTQYGFTYVFDLATLDLSNLLSLRNRIDKGQVYGPTIFTAGVPFAPMNGSPIYIAPLELPEIGTLEGASGHVKEQLDAGADAIKLWSASPDGKQVIPMPLEIVKAATENAHKRNKPVIAHPTTLEGAKRASLGGVDILAHVAAADRKDWSKGQIEQMLDSRMALIPTLKLHKWELERTGHTAANNSLLNTAIQQLRSYVQAGGEILFGTDVGYVTDYSPRDEYLLMNQAGMDHNQILASLTINPAKRFGRSKEAGRISKGMHADMVVLSGDPAIDVGNFAQIEYTIHKGVILFSK